MNVALLQLTAKNGSMSGLKFPLSAVHSACQCEQSHCMSFRTVLSLHHWTTADLNYFLDAVNHSDISLWFLVFWSQHSHLVMQGDNTEQTQL